MEEKILLSISFAEFKSLISEVVKEAFEEEKQSTPLPNTGNERLTRKELRLTYKISFGTIHNLIKAGKLPYEKIGRRTLFKLQDVEEYFTMNKRINEKKQA